MSTRKKVLFILGMHRSGTSALAGCVHLGGISGGRELLEPGFDNEKGFFENRQVFQINEGILAELGLSWDSPSNLPDGWVADGKLRKHKQAIAHFLTSELMHRPTLYVKDPRLCFLLPLWQEVLAEMEIEFACAIAIRHPAEVFQSLRRRNNLDKNKALSLWLNHLLLAEKNSRNSPRRFLFYQDLLEKPAALTEHLLQDFEMLPGEAEWQQRRAGVQDFVDKKLRHHEAESKGGDLENLPYFPTLSDQLQTLAKSPTDPAAMAELDRLRELYLFNLQFFTPAPKHDFFATLKLDCGEKTRLVAPLKLPVFEGLDRLVFSTSHVSSPIQQVLFFPCDVLCQAAVSEGRIEYADGSFETFEPLRKKVLIEHGVEFLFEPHDYVVVEPKQGKQVESIAFNISYRNIGEAALASVSDFAAKIRGWFSEQMQEQSAGFEQEKARLQEQFQNEFARFETAMATARTAAEQAIERQKVLAANIAELERQLQNAHGDLQTKASQIVDLQEKIEAARQELEATRREFEVAKQELKEAALQQIETVRQTTEAAAHLKIEAAKRETQAAKQETQTARQETSHAKQETESAKREIESSKRATEAANLQIAAHRTALKKKDDLIWELYAKTQNLENDYRQALRTLEETRSAFSNKLGRALTAPFRWIYDLFNKKPFNETGLWLFLQFLATGLKMPGRMLSHVNSTNIETLRKALKNESPREIAGNLRKLLVGNNHAATAPLSFPEGTSASQTCLAESLLSFPKGTSASQARLTESFLSFPKGTSESDHAALPGAEVPFGNDKSDSARLVWDAEVPFGNDKSDLARHVWDAEVPSGKDKSDSARRAWDAEVPCGNGSSAFSSLIPHPSSLKKTVLFASPHLPDFDGSSGGKRATRLLELLAQECEVYAFTLGNKPEKHVRRLEAAGVRVFQTTDFQEVKQVLPEVDVLIFSFFYTWFDCGEFLRLYPKAKRVVDTVDVHWVRHERSIGLWEELTEEVVRKKKVLEIDVYQKAEVIWAVTQFDKQAILAEVPQADVRIVSNVHPIEVPSWQDPSNNNLLFFGGFSHYPNIIAVKELVSRVFPKIREQVPDAKLLIAGSNAPPEIEEMGKLPGVEFLGFVDEDQLADLYRNTFLALVPLQTGAGIKGKICEAIAYGVPVVTNRIGNEGIELVNEESGLISDDENELVRLTVRALNREYDLKKLTRTAQEKLQGLVGEAVVKKNMMESLTSPGISICIVTWNKRALLQRCIESIENHTHYPHYQILVYSNGCTDSTQEYLEAAAKINPRIVPVLSKTNDVFVIPNNRMMQLFPQNDVVLLNNDTYVTGGWLEALREAAYSSPEIGIAGAKLLYPNGKLQEFGSELYANGTGRNIGKGDDPEREQYSETKFVGYVSGCVFYVKRQTINQIGVFDETFHPCYCEDSDYCYTAWENGIATVVTPASVVYHDEGATSGTDVNTGAKAYQRVNFEKFLAKHGERLDEIASKIKLKNLTMNIAANLIDA